MFVSNPVYAPTGNYRLKAQVDGRLFWSNFYLDSRQEQRRTHLERAGRVVRIAADKAHPLPL